MLLCAIYPIFSDGSTAGRSLAGQPCGRVASYMQYIFPSSSFCIYSLLRNCDLSRNSGLWIWKDSTNVHVQLESRIRVYQKSDHPPDPTNPGPRTLLVRTSRGQ